MIDSGGNLVNPFRCINCNEIQSIFDTPCEKCGKDKRIKIASREELEKQLKELLDIPLADVHGGRQRTSKENETIIKIRILLRNNAC